MYDVFHITYKSSSTAIHPSPFLVPHLSPSADKYEIV